MPVTDRGSDKNLIELAKQQYENKQKSTVPSVLVPLPSKGQVYPESSPLRKGIVEMRYMTAYDEDILTNSTYIKQGIVLDKLVSALVLDAVNIDDLIVADKEAMIISARVHGYGAEYGVTVMDPNTGKALQRQMDLAKLEVNPMQLQSNNAGEFDYTDVGIAIKFTYISRKEIDSISDDHAVSDFLRASIKEVNGSRAEHDINNFIRYQMTPVESKTFRKFIADNMPSIKLESQFTGEDGGTFTAGFQIKADFFWV
tara:strand:- start:1648 stop:2415 length:768 start_codon:yes stop_codon:yes gene_type:complete